MCPRPTLGGPHFFITYGRGRLDQEVGSCSPTTHIHTHTHPPSHSVWFRALQVAPSHAFWSTFLGCPSGIGADPARPGVAAATDNHLSHRLPRVNSFAPCVFFPPRQNIHSNLSSSQFLTFSLMNHVLCGGFPFLIHALIVENLAHRNCQSIFEFSRHRFFRVKNQTV